MFQATAIVEGFRSTFSDYFDAINGRVKSIHQSINQIATVSADLLSSTELSRLRKPICCLLASSLAAF
jgi:hypothetical protein